MDTKLSEIIQKADRESASATPSFLTKEGASKLKQMQREQEAEDNKLRAEVAKKLNLQDDDETFVQGMYKKIPTNVRLVVENMVGVDSPITAKDFTKEELIEMAFLAEKTKLSNLRTENRYKRIIKSELAKGPPSLEDKDFIDDNKAMAESYEKTRGKTSVNPYLQSNKKIVDANYLDSLSRTFTSPSYRVATSLGKYNAYDKDGKVLNIKDTYNFNKKERKLAGQLPSSFTGALKQMMASPELAGEYLANFLRTEDRDVDINIPKKMNKGGTTMSMNKQMEMFDEGGLKEEGGTVDPVSGNDVPPGSTQEEVRDDIPAQLSEGEFVFPADVVRFIGLEKLMMMRQEAKAGLQRMEDMGQMGNSEEATMPDDMPFDINDLDMEEEENNRDSQEMNQGGMVRVGGKEMPKPRIQGQQMAEGGVVKAATGTFVNQGTGITNVPSQFAGQNLPSYNPNQTLQTGVSPAYTIPTIPAVTKGYDPKFMTGQEMQTNQTAPSFETLIGKNPGQYDEMRTYKNDAGATLQIPFKNGQPIYPIPEGYIFVDSEEEQTETPTVQSVRPTTTQAQVDGGDNDSGTRVGTTMVGKTGKGITDKSLSVTDKTAAVMAGLQQNTAPSALSKGLQTFGKGVMGSMVPGMGLLGGALAGGKSYFSPDDTQNTYGLANALGSFDAAQGIGYDANGNVSVSGPMASVMGINGALETLSQAAYGMSMSDKAKELGLSPQAFAQVAFTKGYKNGQVDPTTNNTYSHGQAGVAFGVPSYANAIEFGKAMAASAKTGFFGSLATAKAIATDPNKTDKQKAKAIAFGKEINPNFEMEIDDRSDAEVSQGLSDAQTSAVNAADEAVSQATSGQTTSSTGFTDMSAFGNNDSPGSSSTNTGPSDAQGNAPSESGDNSDSSNDDTDSTAEDFNVGGLAGKKKKKSKPKKMKRGGLASR